MDKWIIIITINIIIISSANSSVVTKFLKKIVKVKYTQMYFWIFLEVFDIKSIFDIKRQTVLSSE